MKTIIALPFAFLAGVLFAFLIEQFISRKERLNRKSKKNYRIVKKTLCNNRPYYQIDVWDGSMDIWKYIASYYKEEEAILAVENLEEYGTLGEVIYQRFKSEML